jgi:transposase
LLPGEPDFLGVSAGMNQLKVNEQQTIVTLHERGWSKRKIARELGVDRVTVRKYIAAAPAKSPTPQTGSCGVEGSKSPPPQTGSIEGADAKSPGVQTGSSASLCDPWREQIEKAVDGGLSVQRIYQDLVAEHQFEGSYHSVRRFVLRLRPAGELPFRRMECAPGEELQIDFGQGAWVVESGRRRKTHLFRCVLSASRKAYSEAVWRQDTESFIRCIENAFRHFGGVTATIVIDNLKAGVIRADWHDPLLNPKLDEFARHYGTVILPCKPRMARHKGKVEAGVKYAQNNAVKGRSFESLSAQNLFLAEWEQNVAGKRIHGTTRQQVEKLFKEVERPALRPLPPGLFPMFVEAPRTVHRDGYVEFRRAYYSAPPEYVGCQVWVRAETRLLRIYNTRREQIALHVLAEAGKFTTDPAHLHSRKRHIIERGADHLLDQCRLIGALTGTWAEAMYQVRGPQGLRVMQGLLQLAEKHPVAALEKAARTATHHGAWRLHDLKRLLEQPGNVVQLDFLETHPLIRPLEAYRILPAEEPPAAHESIPHQHIA